MSPRRPAAAAIAAGLLAIAIAAWCSMLWFARHSYFGMVPATGVVASLADAILRGQAPGSDDGTTLLATFYLPPFPLLVAAARALGLEWLEALRGAAFFAALLVLAAGGFLARAMGGGRVAVTLAIALVMTTRMFHDSSLGGRADLLAVAFSIASLAAWTRDPGARGWALPALAAGSFLTKATSLTVPLALLVWTLARREVRPLLRFGWRFAACALAGILLMAPAHGPGWYADTFRSLVFATPSTFHWLRGPAELVRYLGAYSEVAVFAAMALALVAGRGGLSAIVAGRSGHAGTAGRGGNSGPAASRGPHVGPAATFLGVSLALAAAVMTNYGAGPNHLDELICACAACAAVWAAPRIARPAVLPAAALALVVAGAGWRDLLPVVRYASLPVNLRPGVIAAVRDEPGETLTEDALVALAAGLRPQISDPGALRSMSLAGDPRALRIVERIQDARYSLVVINEDLERSANWYRTVHLGDLAVAALRSRYREVAVIDNYHLFRPAPPPVP